MTDPTITVGIPTKNVRDTIAETMRMLREQTIPPDRVLIADDSNDDTVDVIQNVYDFHIKPYKLDVFHAPGGVGAAREAIRKRANSGLLLCLDADVKIPPNWIEQHAEIHGGRKTPAVVSGPWPGQDVVGTETIVDPRRPEFFIEANCSMHTTTAERIGGWDQRFRRGCDWDFRIRLSGEPRVDAIASDLVGAEPMATNSSPIIHIKKQFNRPSSVPYFRKYGQNYAFFHPTHFIGDAVGVSALAAAVVSPLWPPALIWVGLCLVAYAYQFDPPGFSLGDRLVASPAVFALGWSALAAMERGVGD